MMGAAHWVVSRRLPALADGWSGSERHISRCIRCQADAAHYRALARALGGLHHEVVAAPAGLAVAVMASLGRSAPLRRNRWAVVEYAAATGAMMAVAGAMVIARRRRRQAA